MLFCANATRAQAQDNAPDNQNLQAPSAQPLQAAPASQPAADAGVSSEPGGPGGHAAPPTAAEAAPAAPPPPQPTEDAGVPPEAARGEAPISPEAILGQGVGALSEEPVEPTLPTQTPRGHKDEGPGKQRLPKKTQALPPLVVWATAGWGNALGPARCENQSLVGMQHAIRVASTMKHSVAVGGVGFAPAGTLSDHPLLQYTAEHEPERLAAWLESAGLSVLSVGAADLSGPLLRSPQLSEALARHGITVIASNLLCNGQAFCSNWATAEKPLHSVQRDGQRYVFISFLPDDTGMRTELASGELTLQPLTDAWLARTREARASGAELIVSSIDHGLDATAASRVADMLADLPPQPRPDLLLSPSSGENLLFMRPIDVQPAVVGTRRGVVTGIKVTKLQDGRDADVLARSVRLVDWDDALAAELGDLAAHYCAARTKELPGGLLQLPLSYAGLVPLAAAAAREQAGADVALVDPLAFDVRFNRPDGARLQRGEIERAVTIDAPLVAANVTLDWLAALSRGLDGPRPLELSDYKVDGKVTFVAGREAVVGATYTIVTTSVLARSDRIPGGANFYPVDRPNATLRGALLQHLSEPSNQDPRERIEDPALATQWILRTDGQLFGNLTTKHNDSTPPTMYDEPALKVDDSRQLGVRFVLNFDADAPKFLFENALNIAFDRNFATKTTATDLSFVQSSYTYRGLWPSALGYPHPFAEAYAETQLSKLTEHWLVRPKLGVRSMLSRVASFKAYFGIQYEIDTRPADEVPSKKPLPGMGAEFQLKPWTVVAANGTVQLEGNATYFLSSPGTDDQQHILRAQLISSYTLVGPLQVTLTALGAMRKDAKIDYWGRALGIQAGVRLRFVSRDMSD